MSLENGEGYSATSGRADASNLHLGSYTSAISTPDNYRADSRMYTKASNRFTVSPGTSGLSNGDAVTLELSVSLDGSLYAAGTPHPGTSDGAQADVTAGLAIFDGYSNQIVDFDAAGQMWGITAWLMSTGKFIFSSGWTESWQANSNISSGISHTDSGRYSDYGGGEHAASHFFDTGLLDLQFEAIVGQTLDVDFFLNIQVYAGGDMQARSDFNNTFAFGLSSTVEGAQIDWEIPPQAQPVPLPGGLMLLGSGLLGLLGLRRRQAKNQG